MKHLVYACGLTLALTPLCLQAKDHLGWSASLIATANDTFEPDAEDQLFFPPTLVNGNKEYVLIPSVQYDWEQWSLGLLGLGWESQTESDADSQISVQLGYPFSYVSFDGGEGLKRYGVKGGVTENDGWAGEYSVTAGPVVYEFSHGVGCREGQYEHSISAGLPLYFNKERGITVFGQVGYEIVEAEMQAHKLKIDQDLNEDYYYHPELNVIGFVDINESLSLFQTFGLRYYDEKLEDEINDMDRLSFSFVSVLTYRFGK